LPENKQYAPQNELKRSREVDMD